MNLIYNKKEKQTVEVSIVQNKEKISLEFSSDCGKFGTHEVLCGWALTPERLMQILNDREDISDYEL